MAVALCADRAVAAAPNLRPEVGELAERIVARLTISFSRQDVSLRIVPQRRCQAVASDIETPANAQPDAITSRPLLSSAQFCLPPPQLI